MLKCQVIFFFGFSSCREDMDDQPMMNSSFEFRDVAMNEKGSYNHG